jgi:hypothetical protein
MASKAAETAAEIKSYADEHGITLQVRGAVLTAFKAFAAGSNEGFTEAESVCSSVLYKLPVTSAGSMWGTDGLSIGGAVGHKEGYMKLYRRGGSVRVLNALKKLL